MKDKHFPEKFKKKLDMFADGFMANVEGANTDEIKKLILSSERNIYEIEYEKDNNEKLLKLKEELKESVAPYSEAKATENAKIKWCLFTLENRNIKL